MNPYTDTGGRRSMSKINGFVTEILSIALSYLALRWASTGLA
jgi:hypothetical protein